MEKKLKKKKKSRSAVGDEDDVEESFIFRDFLFFYFFKWQWLDERCYPRAYKWIVDSLILLFLLLCHLLGLDIVSRPLSLSHRIRTHKEDTLECFSEWV